MRTPLKSVQGDVLRRSAPECRYLVRGEDGHVALAGTAVLGAEKSFEIRLGDRLAPGRYALSLMIAVNGNAVNADIQRIAFSVPLDR